MRVVALILALALSTAAYAQQPDMNTLQKALTVLEQQRNNAMNGQANAETRLSIMADELAAVKKERDELKAKADASEKK